MGGAGRPAPSGGHCYYARRRWGNSLRSRTCTCNPALSRDGMQRVRAVVQSLPVPSVALPHNCQQRANGCILQAASLRCTGDVPHAARLARGARRVVLSWRQPPTPTHSNLFSGTSLSASRPTRQLRATPNPLAPRPLLLPLRCWVPCGPRWAARPDSKPGAQCPAAPPWSRRPRRRTSGASCPTPACPCAWVSLVNAVAGSPRRRHRRCRCCGLGFGEALTRRHRRRPQPPRACAPSFGLVKTLARASPGGRRRSRLPLPLPLPYAGLGAVIMSNQHAHHGSEIAYPYLHSECWQRALAAAAWAPRRLRTAAAAAAAYRALAP